jgi:hypothetical protein
MVRDRLLLYRRGSEDGGWLAPGNGFADGAWEKTANHSHEAAAFMRQGFHFSLPASAWCPCRPAKQQR